MVVNTTVYINDPEFDDYIETLLDSPDDVEPVKKKVRLTTKPAATERYSILKELMGVQKISRVKKS